MQRLLDAQLDAQRTFAAGKHTSVFRRNEAYYAKIERKAMFHTTAHPRMHADTPCAQQLECCSDGVAGGCAH